MANAFRRSLRGSSPPPLSRAAAVPPVWSSASSAATSSSESVKSKTCAFSSMRSRCVDFGSTIRLRSSAQRISTCAGVRPSRSAIAPTAGRRGGGRCRAGCRPPARSRAPRPPPQAPPELERAELDLVDDRVDVGDRQQLVELARAEVRDADRARVARRLRALHAVPRPRRPALRPVDDVEVDVVDAEPLERALRLGLRVVLGRDRTWW